MDNIKHTKSLPDEGKNPSSPSIEISRSRRLIPPKHGDACSRCLYQQSSNSLPYGIFKRNKVLRDTEKESFTQFWTLNLYRLCKRWKNRGYKLSTANKYTYKLQMLGLYQDQIATIPLDLTMKTPRITSYEEPKIEFKICFQFEP